MLQEAIELSQEFRILARREIRALELFDRLDQRFGHEPSAEFAEVAAGVRITSRCCVCTHIVATRARLIAAKSAAIRRSSLMPGASSTPDDTSMPHGWTACMASATLLAVNPPARMMRRSRASADANVQSAVWPVPPRFAGSCASTSSITFEGQSLDRSGRVTAF